MSEDPNIVMFPSIENPGFFLQLYDFFIFYADNFIEIEYPFGILGLIVTIFHLIVLTRKHVMVSSVVSVIIGFGICDLVSLVVLIGVQDTILNFFRDECTPPSTYTSLYILYVLLAVRDDVLRCSTWLSILMTLIRLVSLRTNYSRILKNVSFGFYASGISFLISSVFSILKYLRTKVVANGTWTPAPGCPLYNGASPQVWVVYEQQNSDFFFSKVSVRIFNFINGFVSRMLPCILLPILTLWLVIEIRKMRRKVTTTSIMVRKRTERTTTLVILMAVTFFIANLPSGIFTFIQVVYTDIGFLLLSVFVDRSCNSILTVNATIHCIICIVMSTDYRNVVKKILRIQQKKQISFVS